jgi:hypothetical protein
MGVFAAGCGRGFIRTAVTGLKVIMSVIAQLANSETEGERNKRLSKTY